MYVLRILIFLAAFGINCLNAFACTSAIVSAEASSNGWPMLWKHRDTSHRNNYIDSVSPSKDHHGYIALFNSEDTYKREAWAGVNDCSFAIINTVAGNLPANDPGNTDKEGLVMTMALKRCSTVDDFARLLDSLPKPIGVRTNFGVLDADGCGAYFETDDTGYVRHDLDTASCGYLIRSNFSCSAPSKGGYGYERFHHAAYRLSAACEMEGITPELFTESLSREYYDSYTDTDALASGKKRVKDNNFIPRPSSASSVVIELTPTGPVMWAMLGYPPAAETVPVTLYEIPEGLILNAVTHTSSLSDIANSLRDKMLGNGYININQAKSVSEQKILKSLENYEAFRTRNNK